MMIGWDPPLVPFGACINQLLPDWDAVVQQYKAWAAEAGVNSCSAQEVSFFHACTFYKMHAYMRVECSA